MGYPQFKAALRAPSENPTDNHVLLVLAWHADEDSGLAWPSVETLARETGWDRTTIMRSLKRLEENGHIKPAGKVGHTNGYLIFSDQSQQSHSATVEESHSATLKQSHSATVAQRNSRNESPQQSHSATPEVAQSDPKNKESFLKNSLPQPKVSQEVAQSDSWEESGEREEFKKNAGKNEYEPESYNELLTNRLAAMCVGKNRSFVLKESREVIEWALGELDWRSLDEMLGAVPSLRDAPVLPRAITEGIRKNAEKVGVTLARFAVSGPVPGEVVPPTSPRPKIGAPPAEPYVHPATILEPVMNSTDQLISDAIDLLVGYQAGDTYGEKPRGFKWRAEKYEELSAKHWYRAAVLVAQDPAITAHDLAEHLEPSK